MSKPTRVLHVFGRLDTGGAESRTMDIYRTIDRERVQFDFAIHTEDDCFYTKEIELMGGRIYSFPRFSGKNYFNYKNAWTSFFSEHPEYNIIHGHQTSTGFIYLKEAKKFGVTKRIAHARNSNKDSLIKKYTTMLAKKYATDLLAVSRLAAVSEFGEKLTGGGYVKVLPNAIDVNKYAFNFTTRLEKRAEFNLTDDFAIVHVGRFHPQKNHTLLLEIFKEIQTKVKGAKLFLIGDGPLKEDILNRIEDLGIQDSVKLLGIRSDVPEILQAMDVLLFPSLFEGLPGVVLEAQAAGLPCVISSTITEEVRISDNVSFVSLTDGNQTWANKVVSFLEVIDRDTAYRKIINAGYDVGSVTKYYQNKLYGKKK
ncbi:glycosyltransferase family 1 protein [Alkalihalophilus marmarensis]|uniref:glycosyltransferase family 1 protein n=1 Tax=Alkalihalophilus marmarensis TaxID=521377 RepID=UPI002DBF923C|nr:glycosyltransferase family 1 protein [Alkalihalophilus marmarensis]MEC2073412.1 glycosyltransferase family 1 protein [Alkalihalophilus marmarensis]